MFGRADTPTGHLRPLAHHQKSAHHCIDSTLAWYSVHDQQHPGAKCAADVFADTIERSYDMGKHQQATGLEKCGALDYCHGPFERIRGWPTLLLARSVPML